jgi:hypothetical protein
MKAVVRLIRDIFPGSLTKLSALSATSATSCGRDAVACARDGCKSVFSEPEGQGRSGDARPADRHVHGLSLRRRVTSVKIFGRVTTQDGRA